MVLFLTFCHHVFNFTAPCRGLAVLAITLLTPLEVRDAGGWGWKAVRPQPTRQLKVLVNSLDFANAHFFIPVQANYHVSSQDENRGARIGRDLGQRPLGVLFSHMI